MFESLLFCNTATPGGLSGSYETAGALFPKMQSLPRKVVLGIPPGDIFVKCSGWCWAPKGPSVNGNVAVIVSPGQNVLTERCRGC